MLTYLMLLSVLCILYRVGTVRCHGYLKEPLNRASLWRAGVQEAPINYDDNQLFCGGYQKQWFSNGGRCGICGDDYSLPRPRPYENTGSNSRGFVVKNYSPGATVRVTAEITASHKGYFMFYLCPLKTPDELEEEECFVPLPLADGSGFGFQVTSWDAGEYTTKVVLPQGLSCERCVMRWQYTAGNSWGICANGTAGLGCGPQETFRSCADIAISSESNKRDNFDKFKAAMKKLFRLHDKAIGHEKKNAETPNRLQRTEKSHLIRVKADFP